jgi:hypothetical protein
MICNHHFLAKDLQSQTPTIVDRKFSLPLCQKWQGDFIHEGETFEINASDKLKMLSSFLPEKGSS